MYIPEPDFRVYIDTALSYAELLSWFHDHWSDLNIEWHPFKTSGQTTRNWIDIQRNNAQNDLRPLEEEDNSIEDRWFYYPYKITVTLRQSKHSLPDIDKQIGFAHLLKAKLEGIGCVVHIEAEFLDSL